MLPERPRAVVTGAASGLGRAFALELAARGAEQLLSDVAEAGLEETAALVRAIPGAGPVHTLRCDVAQSDEVVAMRERAYAAFGEVDLLVNNAGVAVAGPVGEIPLDDWHWIVGVNLWGVVYGCHHFLPRMKLRGSGHVLNVASVAGLVHAPEMGPYNATKAAVVALSETMAAELAGTGVGVTVLCPYFFQTNILASSRQHGVNTERGEVEKIMARTKQQARDVARIALEGCDAGTLHVLPHAEAKVLSAIKRTAPGLLATKLAPAIAKFTRNRAAKG
jgi:NAD(P)-dependent dehydrogenase (short-subunit alcohol dehydrogenase family)